MAVYFYSIRALQSLVPSNQKWKLYNIQPISLLQLVDMVRELSISESNQEFQHHIHTAQEYANRSTSNHENKIINDIKSLHFVDSEKFGKDVEYSKQILESVAKSLNVNLLWSSFAICEQFGSKPDELALDHILWLLMNPDILSTDFVQSADMFLNIINVVDTIDRLSQLHSNVREPLFFFCYRMKCIY